MPKPDDLRNHDIDIEVLDGSQERVEFVTMIYKTKRDWDKSVTALNDRLHDVGDENRSGIMADRF